MVAIGALVLLKGGAYSVTVEAPLFATKRLPEESNARPSGPFTPFEMVAIGALVLLKGGAYSVTVQAP